MTEMDGSVLRQLHKHQTRKTGQFIRKQESSLVLRFQRVSAFFLVAKEAHLICVLLGRKPTFFLQDQWQQETHLETYQKMIVWEE